MKAIIPVIDENSKRPYYLQLYDYIKNSIVLNEISANEKLPSIRNLARNLNLSLTTISLAYSQLSVEGYIYSRPGSGFFVGDIAFAQTSVDSEKASSLDFSESQFPEDSLDYKYDLSCFNFNKWKKCFNKVMTDYPHLLLSASNPQGEYALRHEISKYLYLSRGVTCSPSQIVIGAGTQQITGQLSLLLTKLSISHVAMEDPCYLPVKNIFRDREFTISPVAVSKNGIDISKLPTNIKSAVYVCPSNQFPTGAVMPISKRYELLEWANRNNSIIIEDDYDSELRYFGKPIPALKGLESDRSIVYLSSFSSTLFPSIKISYMVLPEILAKIFKTLKNDYTQTCSKAEQLTLALFMEYGHYQAGIRKLRSLYSQKLAATINSFHKYAHNFINPHNTSSGINMIINVTSNKDAFALCDEAQQIGALVVPVSMYTEEIRSKTVPLIFYYNQIPIEQIDEVVEALALIWQKL